MTTLNILLSYCSAFRTGADVTAIFNVRKAFFCSCLQFLTMDFAYSALLYAPFRGFPPIFGFSALTSHVRSDSGCAIVTYPLICHQKKPMSPRNPRSSCYVLGSGQSMTAATLSSLGVMPVADMVTLPNTTSD